MSSALLESSCFGCKILLSQVQFFMRIKEYQPFEHLAMQWVFKILSQQDDWNMSVFLKLFVGLFLSFLSLTRHASALNWMLNVRSACLQLYCIVVFTIVSPEDRLQFGPSAAPRPCLQTASQNMYFWNIFVWISEYICLNF